MSLPDLYFSVPSISKVPVLKHSWSYQSPEIDYPGQPAGDYLHPHGSRVAGVAGQVPGGRVPVGEGHHHVERGQGEHHVEQGPVVGNLDCKRVITTILSY